MSVEVDAAHTAVERLAGMLDLVTPMAVRVAATLRLADHVAEGDTTTAALAGRTGCDEEALGVLLRYLATKDVFAEPVPGEFALTDLSDALRSDHPARLAGSLDLGGIGGRFDLAYTGLLGAVRTGRSAYPEVFGRTLWHDLDEHPELGESFDALMAVMAPFWVPAVVAAHDWTGARHVVDVGGGTGDLLVELLRGHPGVRGTLLELPATAEKGAAALAAAGFADRCEVVPGSFFDSVPSGGDVYVLAHVLHNWPDARALEVLKRCAEAARATPGSRVLVVDRVTGDGPTAYPDAAVSLHMLVVFGSRERTAAQFGELAAAAGLRIDSTRHTTSGSAVLDCVPV